MRTNAIIRILIWSIVILVLIGILIAGLSLGGVLSVSHHFETEQLVRPVTEPTGMEFEPAPIHEPLLTDPLEAESTISTSPTTVMESEDGKTGFSASEISNISIDWVSGYIVIETGNSDQIRIWEEGNTEEKYAMSITQKRDTLNISFFEENQMKTFLFGIHKNLSKSLTIQVPKDWVGQELEIDAASANVEVYDQTFQEVEIDGASGTCLFENCTVQELDLDTASGDVEFRGSLRTLDFDAASASFIGTLTNVPTQIDMDSASGNLCLTLPKDAGFSVKMDGGLRSDFSSDFPTTQKGGKYICGNGQCRIEVDAMSGDVLIWQASTTTQEATP